MRTDLCQNVYDYILLAGCVLDDTSICDTERVSRLNRINEEVLAKYGDKDFKILDDYITDHLHKIAVVNAYYGREVFRVTA